MDEPVIDKAATLGGKAVEDAAVAWVMDFERRAGRMPVDRRNGARFPGDIESPPRVIEVKATARTFRGSFLWLEPVQYEHAVADPTFHLYVVENVGQGDPDGFTLRVLAGEQLRRLMAGAVEKRYYEVPWRVADHDATPVEGGPQRATRPRPQNVRPPDAILTQRADGTYRDEDIDAFLAHLSGPRTLPSKRPDTPVVLPASDIAAAIATALRSLGGEASVRAIEAAVEAAHPGRWADLGTTIADHTYPGSPSSLVPPERRILVRVGRGRYRLR